MTDEPVLIFIDVHEDSSEIMEEIIDRELGLVKMIHMEESDVKLIYKDCIVMIEMKRTDFDSSLHDGRLHSQISRCTLMSNFPILIVEGWKPRQTGREDVYETVRKHEKTIRTLNRKITTYETRNCQESCDIISEIVRDLESGRLQNIRRPVIIQPGLSPRMNFICNLPNIKETLAERILKVYQTPENAMVHLDDWHEDIEGIGKKIQEQVKIVWGLENGT